MIKSLVLVLALTGSQCFAAVNSMKMGGKLVGFDKNQLTIETAGKRLQVPKSAVLVPKKGPYKAGQMVVVDLMKVKGAKVTSKKK